MSHPDFDPEILHAVETAVRPAGDDIAEEARLAYEAASRLTSRHWRRLYLAHFERAHPAPPPAEAGVLQAGDRVMHTGRTGAMLGAATVVAIEERPLRSGRTAHVARYLLDRPQPRDGGEECIGGEASPGGLVHLRDWPATMLGELPEFREVRVGRTEQDWEGPDAGSGPRMG